MTFIPLKPKGSRESKTEDSSTLHQSDGLESANKCTCITVDV